MFKTNGGRTVYGGGGITPDYIIKSEKINEYTRDLLKNNIFYQYSLNYIERKCKELNAVYGSDLERFVKDFQFSKSDIDKFISLAESKDVKFVDNDFKEDKNYIETRLKAQIARNYWKNEGWYSVMLTVDNQVEKALTLFDEAKEIANLK